MHKDRAKQILTQLYPNKQSKSGRVLYNPAVSKQFVKLGFNTYVNTNDNLKRVWSKETLNGQDYMVAYDSGTPYNNSYRTQIAESGLELYKGAELLGEVKLSAVSPISAHLHIQQKLANYTYLPPELFIDTVISELRDLSKLHKIATDSTSQQAELDNIVSEDEVIQKAITSVIIQIFSSIGSNLPTLKKRFESMKTANNSAAVDALILKLPEVITAIRDKLVAVPPQFNGSLDSFFHGLDADVKDFAGEALSELGLGEASNIFLTAPFMSMALWKIFEYTIFKSVILTQISSLRIQRSTSDDTKPLDFSTQAPDKAKGKRTPSDSSVRASQRKQIAEDTASGKILTHPIKNTFLIMVSRFKDVRTELFNITKKNLTDLLSDYPQFHPAVDEITRSFVDNTDNYTIFNLKEQLSKYNSEEAVLNPVLTVCQNGLQASFFEVEATFFAKVEAKFGAIEAKRLNTFLHSSTVKIKSYIAMLGKETGGADLSEDWKLTERDISDTGEFTKYIPKFYAAMEDGLTNDFVIAKFLADAPEISDTDTFIDILKGMNDLTLKQSEKLAQYISSVRLDNRSKSSTDYLNKDTPLGKTLRLADNYNFMAQYINITTQRFQKEHPNALQELSALQAEENPVKWAKAVNAITLPLNISVIAMNKYLLGLSMHLSDDFGSDTIKIQDILRGLAKSIPDADLPPGTREDIINAWTTESKNFEGLLAVAGMLFDKEYFKQQIVEFQDLKAKGGDFKEFIRQMGPKLKKSIADYGKKIADGFTTAVSSVSGSSAYTDMTAIAKHLVDNDIQVNVIHQILMDPDFKDMHKEILTAYAESSDVYTLVPKIEQIASQNKYSQLLLDKRLTPTSIAKQYFRVSRSKHQITKKEGPLGEAEDVRTTGGDSVRTAAAINIIKEMIAEGTKSFPRLTNALNSTYRNTGLSLQINSVFSTYDTQQEILNQLQGITAPGSGDVIGTLQFSNVGSTTTIMTDPTKTRALNIVSNRAVQNKDFSEFLVEKLIIQDPSAGPIFKKLRELSQKGSQVALATKTNEVYSLHDVIALTPDTEIVKLFEVFRDTELIPGQLESLQSQGVNTSDVNVIERLKTDIKNRHSMSPVSMEKHNAVERLFDMLLTEVGTPKAYTRQLMRQEPSAGRFRYTSDLKETLNSLRKFAEEKGLTEQSPAYIESLLAEMQQISETITAYAPMLSQFKVLMGVNTEPNTTLSAQAIRKNYMKKTAAPKKPAPAAVTSEESYALRDIQQMSTKVFEEILAYYTTALRPTLDILGRLADSKNLVNQHDNMLSAYVPDVLKNVFAAAQGFESELLNTGAGKRPRELKQEEIMRTQERVKEQTAQNISPEQFKKVLLENKKTFEEMLQSTTNPPPPKDQQDLKYRIQVIDEALASPSAEPTAELIRVIPGPMKMLYNVPEKELTTNLTKDELFSTDPGLASKRPKGLTTEHMKALFETMSGLSSDIIEGLSYFVSAVDTININVANSAEKITFTQPIHPAIAATLRGRIPANYYYLQAEARGLTHVNILSYGLTKLVSEAIDPATKQKIIEHSLNPMSSSLQGVDIQNALVPIFTSLIKNFFSYEGTTFAPADLAAIVKQVFVLDPSNPADKAMILKAITAAVETVRGLGNRQGNTQLVEWLWERVNAKDTIAIGEMLYTIFHSLAAPTRKLDITSTEYNDVYTKELKDFRNKSRVSFAQQLQDPNIMKKIRNIYSVKTSDYEPYLSNMSEVSTADTIKIEELDGIRLALENMLNTKRHTPAYTKAKAYKDTLLTYSENVKREFADKVAKTVFPIIFSKLEKQSVLLSINTTEQDAQIFGINMNQFTRVLTEITLNLIVLVIYLKSFSVDVSNTEYYSILDTLSHADEKTQTLLQEILDAVLRETENAAPSEFTIRDVKKMQKKKSDYVTKLVKHGIAALPEPALPDIQKYDFKQPETMAQYLKDIGSTLTQMDSPLANYLQQLTVLLKKLKNIIASMEA